METENQVGSAGTRAAISFLTIREHCGRGKRSIPSYYRDVSIGLMVPPIKLGERQSVVPEHESNTIYAARLAGQSPEQIRALVKSLVASRSRLLDHLTQELNLQLGQESMTSCSEAA